MTIDNQPWKILSRRRRIIYIDIGIGLLLLAIVSGIVISNTFWGLFMTKEYTASSTFCVKGDAEGIAINGSSEYNSVKTVSKDFAVLLASIAKTYDLVPATYSVSINLKNPEVVSISVKGKDPGICAKTANDILNIAPEVYSTLYKNGEIEIISYAGTPSTPSSSPNNTVVAITTILFTLIIVGGYIFEVNMIEKSINKEIYFKMNYN